MTRRLFVSVDLDGLGDAVADAQARLPDADGLRLTDPEQAHVTLAFLGDVEPRRVDAVVDALAAAVADADVDPFAATFGGFGVFPSMEYITVVWIGVREGGAELTALAEAVEARTAALGFEPDDHDFTPHVTVARMDHAGGKAAVQEAVRERDPDVGRLDVSAVRLTESYLTDDGPRYETVAAIDLADGTVDDRRTDDDG